MSGASAVLVGHGHRIGKGLELPFLRMDMYSGG